MIQDGASGANLCALLAARERAGGVARHADLVAYTSGEAHSSVEKGARVAGLRPEQLRLVPVDPATRALRPDRLRVMLDEDVAAGRVPFFVCATVGTTSTHAIDPVDEIAEIAVPAGAWLHVDAAHAGRRGGLPRAPVDPPWPRAGGQLLHGPAQVAVHRDGVRRLLGRRPAAVDRRAERHPRVPAQPGERIRRGDRLPGLARAARPPLPGPPPVVRAAPLRRRGAAGDGAGPRRLGPGAGRLDRRRSPLRAGRADTAQPRLLPPPRRRRRDRGHAPRAQRVGPPVPHPHPGRRPLHGAHVRRRHRDRAPPRRGGLGGHHRGGRGPRSRPRTGERPVDLRAPRRAAARGHARCSATRTSTGPSC